MGGATASIGVDVPVRVACRHWAEFEAAVDETAGSRTLTFSPAGPNATLVTLALDGEPEGFAECLGDRLGLVAGQARLDLERFRAFVAARSTSTGP